MTRITPIKTPEQIKKDKNFFHTPFFLAPSKTVFADRALRFQELAREENSDWGAYLQLLSNVCEAQQAVLDAGLANGVTRPEATNPNFILAAADGKFLPNKFHAVLNTFLEQLEGKVSSSVLTALRELSPEQAEALAKYSLAGTAKNEEAASEHASSEPVASEQAEGPAETATVQEAGELEKLKPLSLWLHAVLQIMWTAWAHQLQEDDVPMVEQRSNCPCCGTEAVGSVVMISSDLANLRYMHCPTCNSRWNALRAKCTFCGDQSSMALQEIEDASMGALKGARAECCDHCHSYRKLFLLQHQQYADPIADDLASLALDILIGEDGYQRGGHNPFLLSEE